MSDREHASYRVPSFCPVCDRVMRGSISNHTYYDHGCCSDCFIEFVEDREARWESGWRPDAEELQKFYDKLRS